MTMIDTTKAIDGKPTNGVMIDPNRVFSYNLEAAKNKAGEVMSLLDKLSNAPSVSWSDVGKLDNINIHLNSILHQYGQ